MMTDCYVLKDSDIYRIDSDGHAVKVNNPTGLFNKIYGGYVVFYASNGNVLTNEWFTVGGNWFYAGPDGNAYRNGMFEIEGD